ncbi:carbonic anhydrase [Polymorphobacter megasporae]|uniref:carbonic anhydrase n=1 Tax=Glacieibacterium megasporae TaxID=2835787 RepID=UPI001C1DFCD8|nr:carbonic anhydrase [Polymorphobacter megasporae]UAJ09406.1 carbonic anhydrase [Polymorphobacter megasporae]
MAAFDTLLEGYRRFRAGPYNDQRARFDALAHIGQSPKIMIIACADSRVDPTRIFDSAPGEMFVMRNVANLVPPYEADGATHGSSAAIEFAVTQLEVEHIVVLGHARCGGITASLTGKFDAAAEGQGAFIGRWMAKIEPARDRIRAAQAISPDIDAQQALELAAIRLSLDNLMSFPFVAERVAAGTLALQGAHFDIADGILRILDPATDRYEPVPVDWR